MDYIPNCLAFWQPAIDVNETTDPQKFEVNDNSLVVRTIIVACASFQTMLASVSVSVMTPIVAVAGTLGIPSLYLALEKYRAGKTLDEMAVDRFKENRPVPEHIMDYVITHPEAAKLLVDTFKKDLPEILKIPGSKTGENLVERISRKPYLMFLEKDFKKAVTILVEGLEVNQSNTEHVFLKLMRDKRLGYKFAEYLFENEKIIPQNLTQEQQFECLTTHNAKITQSLIKKKFNTQVEVNNITPYLHAIIHHRWDLVRVFASANIEIPKADKKFIFGNGEITFADFLNFADAASKVIQQISQNPNVPEFPDSTDLPPFPLPFKKPPIQVSSKNLMVDGDDITARTLMVACPLLTASLFISPLAFLSSIAVTWLYNKWEWSRGVKLANEIALNEIKSPLPHSGVFGYIASQDSSIIDRLQGNLTKIDDSGKDLWHFACKDRNNEGKKKQKFFNPISLL